MPEHLRRGESLTFKIRKETKAALLISALENERSLSAETEFRLAKSLGLKP